MGATTPRSQACNATRQAHRACQGRVKLRVLAVGNRMPTWVNAGFEEYARRMPREMPVSLTEIKPEARHVEMSTTAIDKLLQLEHKRISAAIPAGTLRVVLDERGKGFNSMELSRQMASWRTSGQDIALVIGGADGTAAALKKSADLLWSLSPLTLPHGLVRVILAEQLFRAASILGGHPYHRA